jgi:NAD(P)-dependent dehydrogenase (short-subunit alcohol dehydrogenase family)
METVLITGANRGIGLALAEALSRDGYTVIAGCRRPETAADLQRLASQTRLIDVVLLDVNSDELISAAVASVGKSEKPTGCDRKQCRLNAGERRSIDCRFATEPSSICV